MSNVYPDRYKPDASFYPTSQQHEDVALINNRLRHVRDSLRAEAVDQPYLPSTGENPAIMPHHALMPKSEPAHEQVHIEARCDPEWERVVGTPALSIKSKMPQLGRIHERRRAAPLPPRIEAPWMKGHYAMHNTQFDPFGQPIGYRNHLMVGGMDPMDGRIRPADTDEMPEVEGPDSWAGNKIFYKASHLGSAYRNDAVRCQPGSPAKGAEAYERDAALDAEELRMETRFAERLHGGRDLGCGAPPRVYGDAWSRATPNWDTMREERTHGGDYDTSWWHRKEKGALVPPKATPRDRILAYAASAETAPYTTEPLRMYCGHTGREVDPATAVIKAGVVPYMDESAARADWRRLEREALFLNSFADRFGVSVEYEEYILGQEKMAHTELCWLSHAASEGLPGKHIPPPPEVILAGEGITQAYALSQSFIVGFQDGSIQGLGPGGGTMPGAKAPVSKLAVAEQYIAAGTSDGSVVVGSWHDGSILELQQDGEAAHEGKITDLHAVGYCLGVASEDGLASVWDACTGARLAVLEGPEGHSHAVSSVRCIKARNAFVDTVATGSVDCTIKLWDLASAECVVTLEKHGESVNCLDLVGDRLFSASLDGIAVWGASTGACLHHMEKGGEVNLIKVVANIIIVARSGRATNDRTEIVVFDWEKGRELSQLYVGGLECTCLDASTTRVAATLKEPDSNQATVLVWDFGLVCGPPHPAIAGRGF